MYKATDPERKIKKDSQFEPTISNYQSRIPQYFLVANRYEAFTCYVVRKIHTHEIVTVNDYISVWWYISLTAL